MYSIFYNLIEQYVRYYISFIKVIIIFCSFKPIKRFCCDFIEVQKINVFNLVLVHKNRRDDFNVAFDKKLNLKKTNYLTTCILDDGKLNS